MANQISLPNKCRATQPVVFPSDWRSSKRKPHELLALEWRISYRFYDDNRGESKQVHFRKLNLVHTLKERQAMVEMILPTIVSDLEKGYNPFDGKKKTLKEAKKTPSPTHETIGPRMGFMAAIKYAFNLETESRGGVGNEDPTHKFFVPLLERLAIKLGIADMPICDIGRKEIKQVLELCGVKSDGIYSNTKFNKFRAMLMKYYGELIEFEICDANYPQSIKKKKADMKKIRQVLTDDQVYAVLAYLETRRPAFGLYMHCFYHSGARTAEMLTLKKPMVDLANQRIKFLIKKGRQYTEAFRPIPDIAIPFWIEAMAGAKEDDYIFGLGFIPGPKQMNRHLVTHWWNNCIKHGVDENGNLLFPGIADFYTLKHKKVSDLRDELNDNDLVSKQFAERTGTLTKHYDLRERIDPRLKSAGKPLGFKAAL